LTLNFNKLFVDIFQRYSSRTLFRCDDGTHFTYGSVLDLSLLPAIQDANGQIVFCLCANVPGALLGYLGLVSAGAVPVMLSATISPSQLAGLLERYRPAYIWLHEARSREINGAVHVFSEWSHCLLAFELPNSHPIHSSLALLLSTSGSTGSPKMVRISGENIVSNAQAISDYLGLTSSEIPITTLPPSYTYGLSIIHSHLLYGCAIALTNRTMFDRKFWDFLKECKVTSMGGVPYHYEMMRKLKFASMDLPELRTLTQAGGRMGPSLVSEYASHCAGRNMRFFVMYGLAEATARVSFLAPEKALFKPDSIGQAIPGGRLWLEDEMGSILQDETQFGQLVYQGKNVCMGYAESVLDLSKGYEFGDTLKTGDLARRDADGDYYIVGRLKRFLKFFGHRVNLQDIEDELQKLGYSTACSGKDDQLDVYICDATNEQAKLIKTEIISKLKLPPSIIRILSVSEFPRNEAGKIQYAVLQQMPAESLT
jgi:long-chain acyl-CoA synthetase